MPDLSFRMAAALLKRKNPPKSEWSNSGSFINKPSRGWLHPDEQLLPNAGVCYGVRVGPNKHQSLTLCSFNVWPA